MPPVALSLEVFCASIVKRHALQRVDCRSTPSIRMPVADIGMVSWAQARLRRFDDRLGFCQCLSARLCQSSAASVEVIQLQQQIIKAWVLAIKRRPAFGVHAVALVRAADGPWLSVLDAMRPSVERIAMGCLERSSGDYRGLLLLRARLRRRETVPHKVMGKADAQLPKPQTELRMEPFASGSHSSSSANLRSACIGCCGPSCSARRDDSHGTTTQRWCKGGC